MPTSRKPYPYRKRRQQPAAGPVTHFTVSGVRPFQLYPAVDTLHWREGNITSHNPHLIAAVIEQAQARGLNLSNPEQAREAICAVFMSHTVRVTGW